MFIERRVVDNRVFLLGLDKLYRDAIKRHERGDLLTCARRVAEALHAKPADVPVEGYYAEDGQLTEYFRLVRALQGIDGSATSSVDSLSEFQRLRDVTAARLFGRPQHRDKLLPTGRDALSQALLDAFPEWTVARLTAAAYSAARETDDISLVGLAARIQDAVVLTAMRESAVLYAEVVPLVFHTRHDHSMSGRSMKSSRGTRGDSSTVSMRSLVRNYHLPTRRRPSAIGTHTTTMRSLAVVFGWPATIRFRPYATITGPSVVTPTESSRYWSFGNPKYGQPPDIVLFSAAVGGVLSFEGQSFEVTQFTIVVSTLIVLRRWR